MPSQVRAQPGRKPNKYTLHSVLVHSGGVHGGHYYAFIRPKCAKGEQWFRFDDERVTKEEQASAVDAQFGGDDDPPGLNTNLTTFKMARFSNAYMLVYVRDCDRDWVVCDVAEEEIAEHLRLRVKREAEERAQRKKEREEAHLYTVVKARCAALLSQLYAPATGCCCALLLPPLGGLSTRADGSCACCCSLCALPGAAGCHWGGHARADRGRPSLRPCQPRQGARTREQRRKWPGAGFPCP